MNQDVRPTANPQDSTAGHPVHHAQATHHPRSKSVWKEVLDNLKPVVFTLVVLALIALGYGYIHTKHQLNNATSGKGTQQVTQDLVDKIGKLVILPTNETPTTATVNDAAKLKSQQFFAKSQNGDKVLIYSKSGQAVLYRPSANKVVEYTQISFNNSNSP